jgi:hypothetical protein
MTARELSQRIRAAIGAAENPQASFAFNELALEIFAFQFSHCESYRRFCERREHRPQDITTWQEIPALPTSAFKQLNLACGEAEQVFLTSGTTQGNAQRGRHLMPDVALYRDSALAHFRRMVLPDGARPRIVGLLAGPAELPQSSLVQMVEWLRIELGEDEPEYLVGAAGFDAAVATSRLRALAAEARPLCLIGVRAPVTALLDHLRTAGEEIEFPAGTRIVETGGPKGGRTLSDAGLRRAAWDLLGVPGYYCLNEYGMTELSSQYYDDVLERRFAGSNAKRRKLAPPWLRSVAVDPETLEALPDGEKGLLRHVDLANALSVLAVQTEDLGIVTGGYLELHGRQPGAEPRGCALALAHLLEGETRR